MYAKVVRKNQFGSNNFLVYECKQAYITNEKDQVLLTIVEQDGNPIGHQFEIDILLAIYLLNNEGKTFDRFVY